MNWQELSMTSQYQTALAIKDRLDKGDIQEAQEGLEELIDAVRRSEKRAVRSQLVRLMAHVLKWKNQPENRSPSWAVSILQARREIAESQEEVPSLTRDVIEGMWAKCFREAKKQAQIEMRKKVTKASVRWKEVFDVEYTLEEAP